MKHQYLTPFYLQYPLTDLEPNTISEPKMDITNGHVEENNLDHKNELNKSHDSIADEINKHANIVCVIIYFILNLFSCKRAVVYKIIYYISVTCKNQKENK